MPSPLEKIKLGITKADWQLVSDAYFELTNIRIEPASPKEKKTKTTKSQVSKELDFTAIKTRPQVEAAENEKIIAKGEPVKVGKRFNMFSDDGTEGRNFQ